MKLSRSGRSIQRPAKYNESPGAEEGAERGGAETRAGEEKGTEGSGAVGPIQPQKFSVRYRTVCAQT